MYIHIHCIFIYATIYIYIYIHMYTYVHSIHMRIYIYIYILLYVHIYIHVYIYRYIYIYRYTYIYRYLYTSTRKWGVQSPRTMDLHMFLDKVLGSFRAANGPSRCASDWRFARSQARPRRAVGLAIDRAAPFGTFCAGKLRRKMDNWSGYLIIKSSVG